MTETKVILSVYEAAEAIATLVGISMDLYETLTSEEYRYYNLLDKKILEDSALMYEDIRITFMMFLDQEGVYIPYGKSDKSDMSNWIDPMIYFNKFVSISDLPRGFKLNVSDLHLILSNCAIFNSDLRSERLRISKISPKYLPTDIRKNKYLPRRYYKNLIADIPSNTKILFSERVDELSCECQIEHIGKCSKEIIKRSYVYSTTSDKYFIEYNSTIGDEYGAIKCSGDPVKYFKILEQYYKVVLQSGSYTGLDMNRIRTLESLRISLICISDLHLENDGDDIDIRKLITCAKEHFHPRIIPDLDRVDLVINLLNATVNFSGDSCLGSSFKKEMKSYKDPFMLKCLETIFSSKDNVGCIFKYVIPDDFRYRVKCAVKKDSNFSPETKDKDHGSIKTLYTQGLPRIRFPAYFEQLDAPYFQHRDILNMYTSSIKANMNTYLNIVSDTYLAAINDPKLSHLEDRIKRDIYVVEEQRLRLIIALDFLIPYGAHSDMEDFLRAYVKLFKDNFTYDYIYPEIEFLINLSLTFVCQNLGGRFIIVHKLRETGRPDNIFMIPKCEDEIITAFGERYVFIERSMRSYSGEYINEIEIISAPFTKVINVVKGLESMQVIQSKESVSGGSIMGQPSPEKITTLSIKSTESRHEEESDTISTSSWISNITPSESMSISNVIDYKDKLVIDNILRVIKLIETQLTSISIKTLISDKGSFITIPVKILKDILNTHDIFGGISDSNRSKAIAEAMRKVPKISPTTSGGNRCYQISTPFLW
jgi:hypothetical protein